MENRKKISGFYNFISPLKLLFIYAVAVRSAGGKAAGADISAFVHFNHFRVHINVHLIFDTLKTARAN